MKPIDNNGSIRIQFTHNRQRYSIAPGGKYSDPIALAFAQAITARIELDIKAGVFDQSLQRYRGDGVIPAKKPRQPKKLLFLWDEWVKTLGLSDETRADHYEMVRRMISSAKPSPTIDNAAWFPKSGEHLAASTYNKRLGYLRRCCEWAISERLATANPFARLKTKPVTTEPIVPLTQEEISKLITGFKNLAPHYLPFVCFLLATGARTSEAIGIQWKRIDFARGEVTIADSTPRVRGGKGTKRKSTKTNRVTVLNLNEALRQVLDSQPKGAPDELVFKSPEGKAIDRSNFRTAWRKVLASQGIPYRKPYTSRHTTASHAIDQGASLPDVAYILGHKDTRMVSQTYGHIVNRPKLPDLNL
jgi:integrase